ncbi:hypothetical protein FQZ97_602340 [compost metagenome]
MVTTLALMGSNAQPMASMASGSPPTINVSAPFSAAAAPPDMPASTYRTPCLAKRALRRTVELAAAVLRSITIWPSRQCSRMPPAPSTTDSTTLLSGSDSMTTSAYSMTSRIVAAASAPAAAARAGSLSYPRTAMPAPTSRRARRPPILPRPIKPTRFLSICVLLCPRPSGR